MVEGTVGKEGEREAQRTHKWRPSAVNKKEKKKKKELVTALFVYFSLIFMHKAVLSLILILILILTSCMG